MTAKKAMPDMKKKMRTGSQSGNAILMMFAMIGMAGVLTYGLNNVMRGPAATTAEVSRRTIAENNLIATTRLAISAAANPSANTGDCDGDGFVEPPPFRDAGVLPKPTGGGLIPMTLGASLTDPWGTQYGYCVWDPGTASVSDNIAACGGNTAKRLEGAPRDDQYAIAVISAGKDGTFQTTCNAYVDTTPADGVPDTTMLNKGGDDVVLAYTYAEANGIGGGEWKLKASDSTTAAISKNIDVGGGGQFTGKLELKNKGMVLPGDPGDDTVTGACDEAKDQQLRRNTSQSPPKLEICDYANGGLWEEISGGGADGGPFNPDRPNCTSANSGPLAVFSTDTSVTMAGKVYSDGNYVYATTPSSGVRAYAKTDTGLVYLTSATGETDAVDVWSDGNYVYVASASDGVDAYTFNGNSFSWIAKYSAATSIKTVIGDGHYLYSERSNGNMLVYRFNGTSFTSLGSTAANNSVTTSDIWFDGTYLYAPKSMGGTPVIEIVRPETNGSVTAMATFTTGNNPNGVIGDGTYVYASSDTGVQAFTYDGATVTSKGTYAGASKGVWTDGVYVYTTIGNALKVLEFDGTTFTLVDSITPGTNLGAVIGDGDFTYTAGLTTGGLIAYSGFECTSNATGGTVTGYDPLEPETREPLDMDLLAEWTLDDASGTVVADSIADYDGAFVNTPLWRSGVGTYTALNFNKNDRDAVQITGLLGSPHQGTIAMWVNVNSYDTSGYSHFFSLGDNLSVGSGPNGLQLSYNNGGGANTLVTYNDIKGTGWHHVVVTFDDVSNNADSIPDYNIYMDGVLLASAEYTQDIAYTNGSDTWIGRHGNANTTYDFDGSIDEIRVYNRVLGPGEIKKLTNRTKQTAAVMDVAPQTAAIDMYRDKISIYLWGGCMIKKDGALYCWGTDGYGMLGNGPTLTANQASPVLVSRDATVSYALLTTNSDLAPGGNAFSFKMGQNAYSAGGTYTYNFTALQTQSGYYFTDAGSPGVDDGIGAQTYSFYMGHSSNSCISASIYVARVNASGTVQTEASIGSGTSMLGTVTTFSESVDLGTFAATDRLRVRVDMTETCNAAASMDITYSDASVLTTPIPQPFYTWKSVSAGRFFFCAIRSDSTTWCWGDDTSETLGNGSVATTSKDTPSPVILTDAGGETSPFVKISAGYLGACGIKANGKAYCWGAGTSGRNGDGGTSSWSYPAYPVLVGGVAVNDWVEISAGGFMTSCGIRANGLAYCWGSDTNAVLGNGSTTGNQTSAVLVNDPGPWARISVGFATACGVKKDGSGWCWGGDQYGNLGNGSAITANQESPSHVVGSDNWVDIRAGGTHTCGLKTDGSLWCWGDYTLGKLGVGTIAANVHSPMQVAGSGPWAGFSTDYGYNTCAMKTDGSAWCWGDDSLLQLGNGSVLTANQFAPSMVATSLDVPGWGWNDAATIIMAPYLPVALNGSYLSDTAGVAQGFGFVSAGSAKIKQLTTDNQLLIETQTTGASSQITFKQDTNAGADYVTNLVSKWTLDESSGTTAASSPVTFPGTLYNSPTWLPSNGKVAGALSFSANNSQYVRISNHASLRPASFTIMAWIKRNGAQPNNAMIISKAHTSNTAPTYKTYGIGFDGDLDDSLVFYIGQAGTLNTFRFSNAKVPNGVWTHVAMNYTGSVINAYVNGNNVGVNTAFGGAAYDTTAAGDLYIGSGGCASPCQLFNGEIDDVRIYTGAVSTPNILSIYRNQNPRTPRALGYDATSALLEFDRSNSTGTSDLGSLTPDMAIDSSGNIGIGTTTPAAKVDVNGGVRIGYETNCSAGREGAIRFTGGSPAYQYCNGTSWTTLGDMGSTYWRPQINNAWDDGSSAGGTCGIKVDGSAYCWGGDNNGRIGNNAGSGPYSTPQGVHSDSSSTGWTDWKMIVGNFKTTCGLRGNGTIWCWGDNSAGQLGNNSLVQADRPVQVHSDSSSTGWDDWKMVAMGGETHTPVCGIRSNGTLWCWGKATPYGQLGDGQWTTNRLRPVQVLDGGGGPGWSDWTYVSTNGQTVCGIRVNGTLWCWGSDNNGALANNAAGDQSLPYPAHSDSSSTGWTNWKMVSVGTSPCGVRLDGTAWCWGGDAYGQIGNNTTGASFPRPVQVHSDVSSTGWTDWVTVSAGTNYACGIRANGTAWCWGRAFNGVLGNNSTSPNQGRPVQVQSDISSTGWTDWVSISAGVSKTCGVRADGSMWCWGQATNGQLGDGQTTTAQLRPVRVK